MSTTTSWEDFIAAYEGRIASTERALDTGEAFDPEVLQPFETPAGLGPFPLELQARGAALLERNRRLEVRLRDAMTEIKSELGAVNREATAVKGYNTAPQKNIPMYYDGGA